MLHDTLPTDLPVVFISAVTGQGLDELKDVLWKELNSESNKLQGIIAEDNLIHRDKEMDKMASELIAEGEVEEIAPIDDTDSQDIEDLEDYEYEDV